LKRHINYDFAEYTSRNRAFRMVGLKRNDNGSWSARKRIPDDVRDEYAALHGPRLEVKFFAPVGTTAPMAKQQFSEWLAEAARRRRLQREQEPKSPFVFTSERGAPFSTAGFARMVERAGAEAKLGFKAHPHMLRRACGYALANKGHDTRALQAYLGHRNIQHTVRYTELSPTRFKDFWRD
jgi:integrase